MKKCSSLNVKCELKACATTKFIDLHARLTSQNGFGIDAYLNVYFHVLVFQKSHCVGMKNGLKSEIKDVKLD